MLPFVFFSAFDIEHASRKDKRGKYGNEILYECSVIPIMK